MRKSKILFCFIIVVFALAMPLGVLGSTLSSSSDGSGIWIVKFKENNANIAAIDAEVKSVEASKNSELEPFDEDDNIYYTTEDLDTAKAMAESDLVEYVEESGYSYLSYVPNDSYYGPTVPNAAASTYQYALNMLNAESAWDVTQGNGKVKVVVIDSGFTYSHEDGANIKAGYDYITNSTNTKDCNRHGTVCAGIIGATTNNSLGIAGAAPNCEVTMLRCFENINGEARGDNEKIAKAIRDAVDVYDADVISMSFGSPDNNKFLSEAVSYAYSNGAIMVAATGNCGDKTGVLKNRIEYPAAYSQVVGVGSVDWTKKVSYFSTQNKSTYIVAPGTSIYSLDNPDKSGGSKYTSMNGTSMATPYVAALAGLAISANPDITSAQFRTLLRDSSEDLGALGYDYSYGYGLINYGNFFKALTAKFIDVPNGEWYAQAVYDLKNKGIINGRTPYYFEPSGEIKRNEYIKILASGDINLDNIKNYQGYTKFDDVAVSDWFAPYMNWAFDNKIVQGYGEGKAHPEDLISREEMATMLHRYTVDKGITLSKVNDGMVFSDASSMASWSSEHIAALVSAGVINGYEDKTFKPANKATRAETAVMFDRFLINNPVT